MVYGDMLIVLFLFDCKPRVLLKQRSTQFHKSVCWGEINVHDLRTTIDTDHNWLFANDTTCARPQTLAIIGYVPKTSVYFMQQNLLQVNTDVSEITYLPRMLC